MASRRSAGVRRRSAAASRTDSSTEVSRTAATPLSVNLRPTAGSEYSGVIQEYHEVKAFVLVRRPADIRMIGQAPVIGKTIFDMTSDGETEG